MQHTFGDGDQLAIKLWCNHVAQRELRGAPVAWDDKIWGMLRSRPQTMSIVEKFAFDLSNLLNMGLDELALSPRVIRALRGNSIVRLNQLVELIGSGELDRLPRIGKVSEAEIRERVKVAFDDAPEPLRNPYRGQHDQA